jgi:hypothetical protein
MTYTGHTFYRGLAALSATLMILFAWQLSSRWDWGALLFLLVCGGIAVRCSILMSSRVEIAQDRVRLLTPGRAPREVEFRQFASVYAEGRGLPSILLLYYPRKATGLVDVEEQATLTLPAVNGHEALLAALTAEVKR